MSGAEAAGLALGILPLLISAVENYEVTFRPFVTYCRYCKELRDFRTAFATQRQLFESHCLVLLCKVGAESILEERPKNWCTGQLTEQEAAFEKKIADYLGSSIKTCGPLIELIERTVLSIQKETNCLESVASKEVPFGSNAWSRAIKQKVSFSVSQPRLKGKVAVLRELNGDFLALIETVDRVRGARLDHSGSMETETRHSMERFSFVQTASQRLYEAFTNIWSCSAHSVHSANICVDRHIETVSSHGTGVTPRLRFDMAFDCFPRLSLSRGAPVWLEIETSSGSSQADERYQVSLTSSSGNSPDLLYSLKRRVDDFTLDGPDQRPRQATSGKKGKKVCFSLSPAKEHTDTVELSSHNSTPEASRDIVPDLCSRQDLCLFLERLYQIDDVSAGRTCVGVLSRTEPFKHLVFRSPPSAPPVDSISLNTIISSLPSTDSNYGISALERIQLALSLSMVVLQFNASAWLPETWRSSNVHFYGVNQESLREGGNLKNPFLNIKSPSHQLEYDSQGKTQSRASKHDRLSPIRNNVLFGLGVILLELGFESPMAMLHNVDEREVGQENQESDYLTAMRLKKSVGRTLGGRFARLTRQCLDCDFATGDHDLQSLALQMAFYKDVVLELAALEKLFRKLDVS